MLSLDTTAQLPLKAGRAVARGKSSTNSTLLLIYKSPREFLGVISTRDCVFVVCYLGLRRSRHHTTTHLTWSYDSPSSPSEE